jgi:hypothetical protein
MSRHTTISGIGVNESIEPTPPPASDVPPCEPAPIEELVVPHPAVAFGGLDNIPEKLLSDNEQLADELDHAGLDQVLPGEDRAHPVADTKNP